MATHDVNIAGFKVFDGSSDSLVHDIVRSDKSLTTAFALHVGGINKWKNSEFRDVMNRADFVYADGIAIVLLAKIAGARHVERAPTTDIAWSVLFEFQHLYNRRPTVALVGGVPGLAEEAARVLDQRGAAEVVYVNHGYHVEPATIIDGLNSSRPDILFVGMGMPAEAHWTDANIRAHSARIVMTCGGWFGFLSGQEKRAPLPAQRIGLEWVWRISQDPRRLWKRYVLGAVTTVRLAFRTIYERRHARRQR